jgi:uncharacterized protein with HEPN domain
MLDAAERIQLYLSGLDEAGFHEDLRTIDAVCMNLIRIGEGAGELSGFVKDAAPHLPWRRMTDLRNRIAHSYAGLKVSVIWDIATVRVPELRSFLLGHFGREA